MIELPTFFLEKVVSAKGLFWYKRSLDKLENSVKIAWKLGKFKRFIKSHHGHNSHARAQKCPELKMENIKRMYPLVTAALLYTFLDIYYFYSFSWKKNKCFVCLLVFVWYSYNCFMLSLHFFPMMWGRVLLICIRAFHSWKKACNLVLVPFPVIYDSMTQFREL